MEEEFINQLLSADDEYDDTWEEEDEEEAEVGWSDDEDDL